ncbi:MAG: hypothetical protein LJE83_09345 [Gammaproteobacteria bacterium]|nr:hypothetical protein [Gammaproteobacteria bacterium]
MKELVVWLIHFPTGTVAILAAIAALYYPKGSSKHKKAGQVFTIAMLIMLISGGIAGALKGSSDDVFLAALVFYTVFTAWLTVRHRQPVIGILEYLALAYIVIFGLAALSIDPEWDKVREPGVYTFDAIMALIFAVGDIRNILLKGMNQAHRLARHIWRISFSLVWAALSFVDKIIKMLDSTIDQMPYVIVIPVILVLCIMFYWLFRVYKGRAILLSLQPLIGHSKKAKQ